MALIEDFIARYAKEYDFYDQVARLAARRLEADLQGAGVRSIVTSRAKSISRLAEKCHQRENKGHTYYSVDDIFEDIVDLAGVRVALYFPAERDQVDKAISRLFQLVGPRKVFPDNAENQQGKRFAGYCAQHYRVRLRDQDLAEPDKRYALARIEIQVASVLMHAWAEVNHDLVYKPLEGELSEEEYDLLDQLNGLVMAGEISLERLQKAGEARVAVNDRKIANHYDLAVHLLSRAAELTGEPIGESGLGRVDLLFDLITHLQIDTPEKLEPYLKALHGNVELRPLAEQIIDALLAEDPSRYDTFRSIRGQQRSTPYGSQQQDADLYRQLGLFMTQWQRLERLLGDLLPSASRPILPNARQLRASQLLDADEAAEFDRLRRVRNGVVHGVEIPAAADLVEDSERVQALIGAIVRRARLQGGNSPEVAG